MYFKTKKKKISVITAVIPLFLPFVGEEKKRFFFFWLMFFVKIIQSTFESMSDTTTTVVFTIMTVSAVAIISLACLIYKCRSTSLKDPNQYGMTDTDDSTRNSDYADDTNTLSEEDQLMIPVDREDTISSLRDQLSQGIDY